MTQQQMNKIGDLFNGWLKRCAILLGGAILLLIVFIMRESVAYSNASFILLQVACDGALTISSEQETRKISGKFCRGDVQRGMLFGNLFFAIDKERLVVSSLSQEKITVLMNFRSVLNGNYHPWRIGYVDDTKIILSAYRYDTNIPIGKQQTHYYLYQVDRSTHCEVNRLPIPDCGDDVFSCYRDRIYYMGTDGKIYEYAENKSQSIGIKGRSPTISPDGRKIAYASFGIAMDGVYVHDLTTQETTSVLKFLGPEAVYPTIRWSADSRLLAISEKSDIRSTPLYVVNVSSDKVVSKFEKSRACNWFFSNEWQTNEDGERTETSVNK